MKTAATPSFVAELPLRVGADVEALLERTFGFARNLYNATLGTVLGRYQALLESQDWQLARALPKTVKKGASGWVYSKHYEIIRTVYADAQRRAAAHRKCVCNEAVNWVLGQAGCIIVEKNNFKAFQKSRYGKSISKAAPGQFVTNLNVKAVSAGLKVFIVPPYELRPSQHDIETGQYVRHELCERWVKLGQSGLWLNRNALAALNLFWLDDAATRYSAARRSERTLGSRETGWA